jgi:hypothetical protein
LAVHALVVDTGVGEFVREVFDDGVVARLTNVVAAPLLVLLFFAHAVFLLQQVSL